MRQRILKYDSSQRELKSIAVDLETGHRGAYKRSESRRVQPRDGTVVVFVVVRASPMMQVPMFVPIANLID